MMHTTRLRVGRRESLAFLLFVFVATSPLVGCRKKVERTTPTLRFEVVRVDDTPAPFDDLGKTAHAPAGVAMKMESVRPKPKGDPVILPYASVVGADDAQLDSAIARTKPWLDARGLPPDARFAWQRIAVRAGSPRTARTYVLRGDPILTNADIAEVRAVTDDPIEPHAMVKLTPAAKTRFADATRAWIGRRMAILIDGRVLSAPVILTSVDRGDVMIATNLHETDDRAAAALSLARGLGGS